MIAMMMVELYVEVLWNILCVVLLYSRFFLFSVSYYLLCFSFENFITYFLLQKFLPKVPPREDNVWIKGVLN